jgi:hypothetical protein
MDTETLHAYLAGLMDGEGTWSIQTYNGMRSPGARMTMTLKYGTEVLSLLVETFGGKVYGPYHDGHRWCLGQRNLMIPATAAMRPYLRIKADIADRFIAALALWPDMTGVNRFRGEVGWTPELLEEVGAIARALNRH